MIQKITNLSQLSIVTNYLHPSQPTQGNFNIGQIDTNNQSEGMLLLKISGLNFTYIDEIASMKLLLPIAFMSDGVRFFAREVTGTYIPSSVTWDSKPSVNLSQIEAEHYVEIFGSGIASPSGDAAVFDLTNLARKWKKSGTTNTSIAIFTTASWGHIYTPRHSEILDTIEVLVVENARQTGLAPHLSFTEQEAGFAGKGFVNNFIGKLLAAFSGFKTDSQKAPISIGAFYAQQRPTGISPLNQKLSMPSNWRMSFDFGVSSTDKRFTILHPDGSVQHYDEITQAQASTYGIETQKDKVFINFFDFSYLEEETSDLIIVDRQRNQMKLSKTGLIKELKQVDGTAITFVNNGTKITSINADGRNVTIAYSGSYVNRIEFIEEDKSLYFEYGSYGPTKIKLQDINYVSSSTSSGGSIMTKEYIDRYEARYEYNGSTLIRLIDVKLNIAVKFEFTSSKVTKIINQVYSPETNGAFATMFYDSTRLHTKLQDHMGNITYLYQNNYGQCIQKIDGDGNAVAMGYGKVSEDGTQQMLQEESAVIFNVRNPILNQSFDETVEAIGTSTVGWKTDAPTTVKVIDGGVYGDKCLRVRKTTSVQTKVFQNVTPQTGNQKLVFFAKSKDAIGTAKVNVKVYYSIRRLALPGEIGIVDEVDGQAYVIVAADAIIKNSLNIVGNENWTRFEITGLNIPSNATSTSMELNILCDHTEGEVYFDDFQMVTPHRTSYNLIQNGYFDGEVGSLPTGWVTSSNYHYQDRLVESYMTEPFDRILGSRNMMLVGEPNKLKTLSNHLAINGGAGEEFTLVAWAKGYSLATDIFRIKVEIEYPGFDSDVLDFDFSRETTNWQMLLRNITTGKPYAGLTITIEHNGPNTVNFDAIQLYKDASGKHYKYDEKGNLLDQMNSDKTKSSLEYNENHKVVATIDPSGDTYKYTYGTNNKLSEINDAKGNKIDFEYDSNGNRKKSEITSEDGRVTFEQTFNGDNKVVTTKDELGNTSTITYDSKGRIYQETNAKGVVKTSNYDAYDNLIQLIQSGEGKSTAHTYQYNTDQSLKSITTDNGTKYDFVYDVWGKLKQVKVNNQVFASYEHGFVKNGVETDLITKQTYGSDVNESFDFTYDTKGRLQQVKFKNVIVATYHYNDKGQVYQIDTDAATKYFSYDLKGKLIKESDSSGKTIRFDYDNLDQVQKATFDINGAVRSYDFEYTNEFNQYNKEGLRTRIANAFGDDVVKDYFSYSGLFGMRTDLVSSAYFGQDNILKDKVITLTKNSSKVIYDLTTVNMKRTTGKIHGGWFDKIDWRNRFYYNKSFFGWFRLTNLTDERVIMSVGKDGSDYFKVLAKKVGSNHEFTLKYTKGSANETKATKTIPAEDKWIFVGFALNKAESNTELAFAVEDQYVYSFMGGTDVTYELNKLIIGDRGQSSGGSNEPNSTYQPKVHMLTVGAYKHRQNTFKVLYNQGVKYLSNDASMTPKTGVSFENPELYDGLDTVTLNGSFISKYGIKPLSYAYTDKSYALDKTRLFEYSNADGKHIYGSYDGLMGLSDTKGKLVYDFDLNTKGTLSIRFKPTSTSTANRTIIMNKKDGNNLFGVILKSDNKLYMILNGSEYLVRNAVIPMDSWKTVVLTWNGSEFKIYDGVTTLTKTASVSLQAAQTIIGSDLDGFSPIKHLNGQLEMLAYKDDVLDVTRINKLFQSNHMMSVKTHVDILGRSKKDVIDTGIVKLENTYAYKSPGSGKTSLQVESITKYDDSVVSYAYDVLGNVTSMTTPDGIYEYQYDYLNRLVREYNPVDQRTLIMSYSGNNNILSKKYYSGNQPLNISGTPVESFEYSYDTTWKDKLLSIVKKENGVVVDTENFSYSSNFVGNPSQVGNKILTWKGTSIASINGSNIEYSYNNQNIRTGKKVDGIITNYVLNGSDIISETRAGNTTRYNYDEKNRLVGFEYLGKQYFYIRDLHRIITEIVDENGQVMVSYKYDAWGNIIGKTVNNSTIDDINHFVYKGYYLDQETGWYYLKSRYYNPNVARFINSDNMLRVKLKNTIGMNLFTYCRNNPVKDYDANGNWGFFEWIEDLWEDTKEAAEDAWEWTKDTATGAWNWVTDKANDAWNWTKDTATGAWNWVTDKVTEGWNWVTNTANNIWNWVVNTSETVWNWVSNTASSAWNWITNTALPAVGSFFADTIWQKGIVDGLWYGGLVPAWNWFSQNWKTVVDWIAGIGGVGLSIVEILSLAGVLTISGPVGWVLAGIGLAFGVWGLGRQAGWW
jgi:RHS repeat-associated protein